VVHFWSAVLHGAEVLLGGVWLVTGFVGTDPRRFAHQLARAGVDPRAARPSLWIQRLMGTALVALGAWGFLH
jgi:hypothetical protein